MTLRMTRVRNGTRLSRVVSGRFLDQDLTGWGHGRWSKRVVRRVDFSVASDQFVVSVARVLGGSLGGVGMWVPCLHVVLGGWCR